MKKKQWYYSWVHVVFMFRLKFVIRLKFKTKHKYGGHKFVTAVNMFRHKFKPNHKFKTKHKYDMNPTIEQESYGKGQNWTVKVEIFDKY